MAKRPTKKAVAKPRARRAASKPARKPDSRCITVIVPFNYPWPGRQAVTHFSERDLGEYRVKNEVADFAVGKGYAREGKLEEQGTAETADAGTKPPVGDQDAPDADRPAGGPSVDSDAG
jgi:hypothetical protein